MSYVIPSLLPALQESPPVNDEGDCHMTPQLSTIRLRGT